MGVLLLPLYFLSSGLLPNISRLEIGQEFTNLLEHESAGQKVKGPYDVCLTPGCVKAAANLLKTVDESKDPCNDFFDFACGKFLQEAVIPDENISTGTIDDLIDKLHKRLRKLFESNGKVEEPEIFNSVRNLYSSCMDQDIIDKTAKTSLLKFIKELGGWPVLLGDSWSGKNFVWQKLSEAAYRKGMSLNPIIDFIISINAKDSTKRIIEISQPSLGLEREYLIKGLEDKSVQAYFRYMIETAVYLGADKDTATDQLKASLLFEFKIAELSLSNDQMRNPTALNNQMTLAEASKLYPGYNWVDYINNFFNNKDATVNANEVINVATPTVIYKIGNYIKTVDSRVVANYMMWRYIDSLMPYQNKEANNILHKFNKVITGEEMELPRWKTCVQSISGLSNAIGSMYAKEYFPVESKKVAEEVVESLKHEFIIMLNELTWMDSRTKCNALKKVTQITSHIAYPEEILDNKLIDEFYSGLKLDSQIYLENVLTLKEFVFQNNVREFRKPIDKQSWKTHGGAAQVNAFYSPSENSIRFPAGILDGTFFQSDWPSYMNYGSLGAVAGHEITHGFDDEGSQYDGEGNLVDWWERATKEKYTEKANCIKDQYGNYTVEVDGETLNINGLNTLGENIADAGGFKEAIRAYGRLVAKQGPEPKLPGLPYTPRQLFWISGANFYCTAYRPEFLKMTVLTDTHSPDRFRVNGPLRNSEEFAADWNCPLGSPMNPEHKCTVW